MDSDKAELADAQAEALNMSATDLVARLIQQNYNDYSAITSRVVEGLQRQVAHHEATLSVIRQTINQLFATDYMPTESAIAQAVFFPDTAKVRREEELILAEIRAKSE